VGAGTSPEYTVRSTGPRQSHQQEETMFVTYFAFVAAICYAAKRALRAY